ncbi:hypothetical protein N7486_003117 [Penicillium sp. IBT 16267x]|nr:hypothetical protein N7486_003117 [Penicillium sp. IBT 16267x]
MDSSTHVISMKGGALRDASQWVVWYNQTRRLAINLKVWELVNPEVDESTQRKPIEDPIPPTYPMEEHPGGVDEDGNLIIWTAARKKQAEEDHKRRRATWKDLQEVYRTQKERYKDEQNGLSSLDHAINRSVDPTLHRLLDRYDSVNHRLRFLQNRFGKSTYRMTDVLQQWLEAQIRGPRKGADVIKWLDNWQELREEVVSLGLESERNHARAFLIAVKDVMPVWWESRFQDINMRGRDMPISTLLESFRSTYNEMHKVTSVMGSQSHNQHSKPAFATSTWQGFKEAEIAAGEGGRGSGNGGVILTTSELWKTGNANSSIEERVPAEYGTQFESAGL